MTDNQKAKCKEIILSAHFPIIAARAIPGNANALILPICKMVVSLGKVFGYPPDDAAVKAIATCALVTNKQFSALVDWIPCVGNIVNVSLTEKIGWSVAKEFDRLSNDLSEEGECKENG